MVQHSFICGSQWMDGNELGRGNAFRCGQPVVLQYSHSHSPTYVDMSRETKYQSYNIYCRIIYRPGD